MVEWCPKCHAMLAPGLEECPSCGEKLKPAKRANPLSGVENATGLTGKDLFWLSAEIIVIGLIPILLGLAIAIACLVSGK